MPIEVRQMRKLFRTFALLLAGLLTVSVLAGCGGDDDTIDKQLMTLRQVVMVTVMGVEYRYRISALG